MPKAGSSSSSSSGAGASSGNGEQVVHAIAARRWNNNIGQHEYQVVYESGGKAWVPKHAMNGDLVRDYLQDAVDQAGFKALPLPEGWDVASQGPSTVSNIACLMVVEGARPTKEDKAALKEQEREAKARLAQYDKDKARLDKEAKAAYQQALVAWTEQSKDTGKGKAKGKVQPKPVPPSEVINPDIHHLVAVRLSNVELCRVAKLPIAEEWQTATPATPMGLPLETLANKYGQERPKDNRPGNGQHLYLSLLSGKSINAAIAAVGEVQQAAQGSSGAGKSSKGAAGVKPARDLPPLTLQHLAFARGEGKAEHEDPSGEHYGELELGVAWTDYDSDWDLWCHPSRIHATAASDPRSVWVYLNSVSRHAELAVRVWEAMCAAGIVPGEGASLEDEVDQDRLRATIRGLLRGGPKPAPVTAAEAHAFLAGVADLADFVLISREPGVFVPSLLAGLDGEDEGEEADGQAHGQAEDEDMTGQGEEEVPKKGGRKAQASAKSAAGAKRKWSDSGSAGPGAGEDGPVEELAQDVEGAGAKRNTANGAGGRAKAATGKASSRAQASSSRPDDDQEQQAAALALGLGGVGYVSPHRKGKARGDVTALDDVTGQGQDRKGAGRGAGATAAGDDEPDEEEDEAVRAFRAKAVEEAFHNSEAYRLARLQFERDAEARCGSSSSSNAAAPSSSRQYFLHRLLPPLSILANPEGGKEGGGAKAEFLGQLKKSKLGLKRFAVGEAKGKKDEGGAGQEDQVADTTATATNASFHGLPLKVVAADYFTVPYRPGDALGLNLRHDGVIDMVGPVHLLGQQAQDNRKAKVVGDFELLPAGSRAGLLDLLEDVWEAHGRQIKHGQRTYALVPEAEYTAGVKAGQYPTVPRHAPALPRYKGHVLVVTGNTAAVQVHSGQDVRRPFPSLTEPLACPGHSLPPPSAKDGAGAPSSSSSVPAGPTAIQPGEVGTFLWIPQKHAGSTGAEAAGQADSEAPQVRSGMVHLALQRAGVPSHVFIGWPGPMPAGAMAQAQADASASTGTGARAAASGQPQAQPDLDHEEQLSPIVAGRPST